MSYYIRAARLTDAADFSRIYEYYVKNTAVSFEYAAPTPGEFESRIASTMEKYPYFAVCDESGAFGYAYAGPLGVREAYARSAKLSIYLEEGHHGVGVGRALYEKLEAVLRAQGIINLYADIARSSEPDDPYLTDASLRFHEAMGYTVCGALSRCGRKFGRWYDVVWMEKFISEHSAQCPEIVDFGSVRTRFEI